MATVVDLTELNPPARFTFEEAKGDEEESWVKIRAYSEEVLDDIRKKCMKRQVEYKQTRKHGPLQRIEYWDVDADRSKELLWDYVIVDWGGFKDKKGKEIPCTPENKAHFMRSWPAFNVFVDKCLERLTPDYMAEVEESEKN